MKIGDRIKQVRTNKGMTQKELADILKISYVNISQIENNAREPKLETLQRIAIAMHVRLEDILGIESFDTGADFDKRHQEILKELDNHPSETLTIRVGTPEARVLSSMRRLNDDGKEATVEQVELLTRIPDYQQKEVSEPEDND